MRNGVCPKCSSENVFAARGGIEYGEQGGLRAHIDEGFRGIRVTQPADDIWQYVCSDCGYVEAYLLAPESVEFVRQHWIPVPGGPAA
jgi:predicted nucleic-acid-binding Zn-ribbon protein